MDAPVVSVQPAENYPGVYNIRVRVPEGATAGYSVPVRLKIAGVGGALETNQATMAIELPRP